MVVFKPKTRMVSIRLSEDEYHQLYQTSLSHGARSVSDFARDALFRALHASLTPDALEARMNQLASDLRILDHAVQNLRHTLDDRV